MENQITDPQALSQSQGIPGMTTTDNTPIAPPEGYEDAPQENILARVQAAMTKFQNDMNLMAQGTDPHPPVPVTVEEVDDVLRDIHGILTVQPGNEMAKSMQDTLLDLRQRIIQERSSQPATEQVFQPEPVPQKPVEEPNPQVLTTEQVVEAKTEENVEVENSIAALQEDDSPFSMQSSPEQAAPAQAFDPTQAQFAAAEPPAEQVTTTTTETVQAVDTEMPTMVEDTDDNEKVVITRRQVHRADMPTAPDGRRINTTFNKTLEYFLRGYMKDRTICEELDINGATISNSSNIGVFEEGGANQREGSVLLATDPNGLRLPALVSYAHQEAVNGKHALITISKDCYILMGGQQQDRSILGIYRVIDTEIRKDKKNKSVSEINGELVAYATDCNTFALEKSASQHDKVIWSGQHPAVKAAFARMYEKNADRPIYIQDYRDCYCDVNDLMRLMADPKILSTIQYIDTLEEAYTKVGNILSAEVGPCMNTNHLPTLSFILNYLPEHNVVAVYLIATTYDKVRKTSDDRCLMYARVILYPGSVMYYPDKIDDPSMKVPFTTLVDKLSRTGGKMVSSLRRVTK